MLYPGSSPISSERPLPPIDRRRVSSRVDERGAAFAYPLHEIRRLRPDHPSNSASGMAAIRVGNGSGACMAANELGRGDGRPLANGFRGPAQFLKIAGFANPPCGKVRAVTLRTTNLLLIGHAPDQLGAKN